MNACVWWWTNPGCQDELPPSLAEKYTAPGEGDSVLIESSQPGATVIMDYRSWHRGRGPGLLTRDTFPAQNLRLN